MNAIGLTVTTGLLAFAAQETAGERVWCRPGECWFPDHMEMLASSYEEVDHRVDAVVIGRVVAAGPSPGPEDSTEVAELASFWIDVIVDDPLAGCALEGDRFSARVVGYGRRHWRKNYWQAKSAEEMAPVLALAEANWNLEREVHDRADLGFFENEMLARYERNRQRLLGMARELPLLVLGVNDKDIDGFGRWSEVVVVPGQRYLMFVPGGLLLPSFGSVESALNFDVYPASFVEHLPRADRPKECDLEGPASRSKWNDHHEAHIFLRQAEAMWREARATR